MGSLLAKAQTVPKTAAPKNEFCALSRYLEPRAFDHVPAETSTDDHFEIPTSDHDPPFAIKLQQLRPARVVPFDNLNAGQPRAYVGLRIALQRSNQALRSNPLGPVVVRSGPAVIITNSSQIGGRGHAPERPNICCHPSAARVKVGIDKGPARI